MSAATDPWEVEVRPDGVAVVRGSPIDTLRPDFAADLVAVLARIASDGAVCAAVLALTEVDPNLVGADLRTLARMTTRRDAEALCRAGHAAASRLAAASKPIVAAIHGPLRGGAFEVALACRGRVASSDRGTLFGLPEPHLGLVPRLHGLQRLAGLAGLQVALDLGLSGRDVRVSEAAALGIVDEVVPRSTLVDGAARRALALARGDSAARPRPPRSASNLVLETNPLGRRVLFGSAREELLVHTHGDAPAGECTIAILEHLARRGFAASCEVEAAAFGDLAVSTTSRRRVELFLAAAGLASEPRPAPLDVVAPRALEAVVTAVHRDLARERPTTSRLLAAVLDEAASLVAEGATAAQIDGAMREWGFPAGPCAVGDHLGVDRVARLGAVLGRAIGAGPTGDGGGGDGGPVSAWTPSSRRAGGVPSGRAVAPEEIQLRCALQLVNEALRCLAEGSFTSPDEGDVRAVVDLGFPASRGGPFRYVDAVGPAEIVRRCRPYERRFGARWAPAPRLLELARDGRDVHPHGS